MRILHTADWHLGKTLRGISREADQEEALARITEIAREYGPDLIVHAGDLFDVRQPPISVLEAALIHLRRLSEIAPVVVVRGNHDSPALFRLFEHNIRAGREPLAGSAEGSAVHAGVPALRFVSEAAHPHAGGILHYPARGGAERIRLAPVPFIHAFRKEESLDAFFSGLAEGPSENGSSGPGRRPRSSSTTAYNERLAGIFSEFSKALFDPARGYDSSTDIALLGAHLMVGGAVLSGSERAAHTTEDYAADAADIPAYAAYAAFGHIHKPQALPGGGPEGAYSGSPVELDFGEAGERKGVYLVEGGPMAAVRTEFVELGAGRPLLRLDGSLGALAEQMEAEGPEARRALVWATVRTEAPEANLAGKLAGMFPEATLARIDQHCASRRLRALDLSDTETSGAEASDSGSAGSDRDSPAREGGPPETGSGALRSLFDEYLVEVGAGKDSGISAKALREQFARALEGEPPEGEPPEDENLKGAETDGGSPRAGAAREAAQR